VQKRDITPDVAGRLVAAQFPDLAHLPIRRVALDGWDNTTFRLGDELSLRLPSHDAYVPQVEKEHRWLPVLAPRLPVAIPEPVAMGRPDEHFPRPWSIYRWIDGEPAQAGRVPNLNSLAAALAAFLTALQAIDASDGPLAGAHSFFRGASLSVYDIQTRETIERVAGDIDADAATDVWDAALSTTWQAPPVWVHGDVFPSNLLVTDGRLRAVIDFGCSAVGDPACDLAMAWTDFDGESRMVFRRGISVDEATWTRARGWALWKALITLADARSRSKDPNKITRRLGWRLSATQVIESVLADPT
jgi:aminoglycoside phosphotransferase (APT) family kinase protein